MGQDLYLLEAVAWAGGEYAGLFQRSEEIRQILWSIAET